MVFLSKPCRAPPLILVVEDEPLIVDVVEEVLVEWGFRVLRAANAVDAICTLIDNRSIALVFSGVVMLGEIDGFGLARWIDVNYPSGNILLTSGYSPDMLSAIRGTRHCWRSPITGVISGTGLST